MAGILGKPDRQSRKLASKSRISFSIEAESKELKQLEHQLLEVQQTLIYPLDSIQRLEYQVLEVQHTVITLLSRFQLKY